MSDQEPERPFASWTADEVRSFKALERRYKLLVATNRFLGVMIVVSWIGAAASLVWLGFGLYDLWRIITAYLHASSLDVVSHAYAAESGLLTSDGRAGPAYKVIVTSAMLIAVLVMFAWTMATISFSRNPKAVAIAIEMLKTLSGFFIGALTGVVGS